jgi:hypothetical protein
MENTHKWVNGYYVQLIADKNYPEDITHYILTGASNLFYGSRTCRETFDKYEIDPQTLGQYTGFKYNEQEIYAGDVFS